MTIPKQCYSCGGACGGGHDGKPCRYVAIPELPEPAYHRAHQPNHSSEFRRGDWTGNDDRKWSRGWSIERLYTADQMRAYGELCRATAGDEDTLWLAQQIEGARDYATGGCVRPDDDDPDEQKWWDDLTRAAQLLRALSRGVPEGMVARECPHRFRCDCLGACKYGLAGNGAESQDAAAIAAQRQGE